MDSQLTPYQDIVNLIRQWEAKLELEDAPQIRKLREYDLQTLCSAITAIFVREDADTRLSTIDVVPLIIPPDQIFDLLMPCLFDERSSVRWATCKTLRRYPDARMILTIVKLLQEDKNPSVRVLAADLLCEFGDEQALDALSYAATHDVDKDFEGRSVAEAAREAIDSIHERATKQG
jgi:HEAT repeat protein